VYAIADVRCAKTHEFAKLLSRLAMAALLTASLTVIALDALVPAGTPSLEWATVSVDPGASLWAVAANNPVPGLTAAELVQLIRAENDLPSSTLHPGQSLRIPAGHRSAEVAVARQ
jgi:hypothetical protein